MNYTVILDDEVSVIVDGVVSIENEDDEIIFKNGANDIIAIISKNDYKAIVQNVT